jgi:hypothetical protein
MMTHTVRHLDLDLDLDHTFFSSISCQTPSLRDVRGTSHKRGSGVMADGAGGAVEPTDEHAGWLGLRVGIDVGGTMCKICYLETPPREVGHSTTAVCTHCTLSLYSAHSGLFSRLTPLSLHHAVHTAPVSQHCPGRILGGVGCVSGTCACSVRVG